MQEILQLQELRESCNHSGVAALTRASCLDTCGLIENRLAQADVERRHLDRLILAQELERLIQGEPLDEPAELAPETFDFTGLRLMAHVAGIGDVFVNLNEWIAGPSAPSRIEGIAVEYLPFAPLALTP